MRESDEVNEEILFKIACDISMQDSFESHFTVGESKWTPQDTLEAHDSVKLLEEIIENVQKDEDEDDDDSDNFANESVFAGPDFSSSDSFSRNLKLSPSQSQESNGSIPLESVPTFFHPLATMSLPSTPESNPISHFGRRPSRRGREKKISEVVFTVSSKLRYFQQKIVMTIESTTPEDVTFAALWDLNTSVQNVLSKADTVLPRVNSHLSCDDDLGIDTCASTSSSRDSLDASVGAGEGRRLSRRPSIHSVMYMLRRMGDRRETLNAVRQLIDTLLFSDKVETKVAAVYEMREAGVLQGLLVALTKCTEWPDVELQISKAISVLVTYEDNWALLQKSAYDILTALYMLQLKSSARAKAQVQQAQSALASSRGASPPERTLSPLTSSSPSPLHSAARSRHLEIITDFSLIDGSETRDAATRPRPHGRSRSLAGSGVELQQDPLESNTTNDTTNSASVGEGTEQTRDIRDLVAAALAKLTLVLCAEWGKAESPVLFPGAGNNPYQGAGGASSGSMAVASSAAMALDRMELGGPPLSLGSMGRRRSASASGMRESLLAEPSGRTGGPDVLSGGANTLGNSSGSNMNQAGPTRRRSSSGTRDLLSGADATRTLEIFINIILNVCESAYFSLHPPEQFSYPTTPRQQKAFLQQQQQHYAQIPHSQPQAPPLQHDTSAAVHKAELLDLLSSVDNASVLCSIALCNLAEVPQCRPGLVQGGALRLLRHWLDIGADILEEMKLKFSVEPSRGLVLLDHINDVTSAELEVFRKGYAQVCDLINNAAAAIMYILGGQSDCRYHDDDDIQAGAGSSKAKARGDIVNDYTIGWIDAQIVSEGLTAAIVRFIVVAIESNDDTSVADDDDEWMDAAQDLVGISSPSPSPSSPPVERAGAKKRPSIASNGRVPSFRRSRQALFPRAAGIHLAQAIFQLSRRQQNRQHLLSCGAPLALCSLFVSAVTINKAESVVVVDDTIPMFNNPGEAAANVSGSISEASNKSSNLKRVHSNAKKVDVESAVGDPIHTQRERLSLALPSEDHTSTNNEASYHHGNIAASLYMVSLASACLDSLTYFLSDAMASSAFPTVSMPSAMLPKLPLVSPGSALLPMAIPPSPKQSAGGSSRDFGDVVGISTGNILVNALCGPHMIEALKFLMTTLPRGNARLAALRVVSMLSSWPVALPALVKGDITEVLVHIAWSGEELQRIERKEAAKSAPKHVTKAVPPKPSLLRGRSNEENVPLLGPPMVSGVASMGLGLGPPLYSSLSTAKPKLERAHSTGSVPAPRNIGSVSPSFSTKSDPAVSSKNIDIFGVTPRSASPSSSDKDSIRDGFMTPFTPLTSVDISSPEGRVQLGHGMGDAIGKLEHGLVHFGLGHDEGNHASEIALEETMVVCEGLANVCQADITYASRVFNSGLLQIMLKLVLSDSMAVGHQAIRCVSAMCPVITESPTDRVGTARLPRSQLYSQTLRVLTNALQSPSPVMQHEAMAGIAKLCQDPSLLDEIIGGPFRIAFSFLINRDIDKDTRTAAEEVVKKIGFVNGLGDLELCRFDIDLMIDWYQLRKFLKLQVQARNLLVKWFENLFGDEPNGPSHLKIDVDEDGENPVRKYHSLSDPTVDSLHLAEVLETVNSGPNKGRSSSHENAVDSTSKGAHGFGFHHHQSAHPSYSPGSLLTPVLPHLHKNFTESLSRFLPFCFGKGAMEVLREEEEEEQERAREIMMRDFMDSPTRPDHHLHRSKSTPSTAAVLPIIFGLGRSVSDGDLKPGEHQKIPHDINSPPIYIHEFLDVFYPSKLHQLYFMDLTSLHNHESLVSTVNISPRSFEAFNAESLSNLKISLPLPKAASGMFFPERWYTFDRIRRVVERMLEEGAKGHWSLAFRADSFHKEDEDNNNKFYMDLTALVRKYPQVVSLSFCAADLVKISTSHRSSYGHMHVSNHSPEKTAFLGHMAGSIPASVRFLNLRGVMGSESVQTMCILLRQQNAAFESPQNGEESPAISRHNSTGSMEEASEVEDSPTASMTSSFFPVETFPFSQMSQAIQQHPTKGLLGLAITHTVFTAQDIQEIISLLSVYPPPLRTPTPRNSGSGYHFGSSKYGSPSSSSKTNGREGQGQGHFRRGIRFLDLSHCNIGDQTCAALLRAASYGPLEGLDLGSNHIQNGVAFMDMFAKTIGVSKCSYLHHLGLASNQLSGKCLCSLFDNLRPNRTLTSLDVSGNDWAHTKEAGESLRYFLASNTGLRSLDLSHNRLTTETLTALWLGILDNNTLLIMALDHNSGLEKGHEVPLLNERLREHRLKYKSRVDAYNKMIDQLGDILRNEQRLAALESNGSNVRSTVDELAGTRVDKRALGADVDGGLKLTKPTATTAAAMESVQLPFAVTVPLVEVEPVIDASQPAGSRRSAPIQAIGVVVADNDGSRSLKSTSEANTSSKSISAFSSQKSDVEFASSADEDSTRSVKMSKSESGKSPVDPSASPGQSSPSVSGSESQSIDSPLSPTVMSGRSNVLNVFFSAPLAWKDKKNKLHGLGMLDYGAERDSLLQVLREVHRDIAISFEFATTDSLRTALSFGCRALHFSGHGHPSCLNFEDGKAGLQLVTVDALRRLLRAGGLQLDFVFVSACFSRKTGEAFIEAGVPHVVCVKVNEMIQDSAAMAFTRAFYIALFAGKTVQEAFDIACEALKASPYVPDSVLEGEKFILLPDSNTSAPATRDDIEDTSTGTSTASAPSTDETISKSEKNDVSPTSPSSSSKMSDLTIKANPGLHDVPIFQSRLVLEWPVPGHIRTGHSPSDLSNLGPTKHSGGRCFDGVSGSSGSYLGSNDSSLPTPPPDFEGREVDMYRVITTLLARRLVTLIGDQGVGKSSLTASVCTYVADRNMFPDGVMYLRAKSINTHANFLVALQRSLLGGPPRVIQRLTTVQSLNGLKQLLEGGSSGTSSSLGESGLGGAHGADSVYPMEERIVTCLSPLKLLLVIDHVDDLNIEQDTATDFKYFLGRLFDRCKHIKVLVTNTESLGMRHVHGFGIVENCVDLGPLNLKSSIRLFARLAPSLLTSTAKADFIAAMLPSSSSQAQVTATSRDLTAASAQILAIFGNGHPAQIVKLACESTAESIQAAMEKGLGNGGERISSTSAQSSHSVGAGGLGSGKDASEASIASGEKGDKVEESPPTATVPTGSKLHSPDQGI